MNMNFKIKQGIAFATANFAELVNQFRSNRASTPQAEQSDHNLGLLKQVLKDAEQATACRIHLVFQKAAFGYVFVSAFFAAIAAFLAGMLMASLASSASVVVVSQLAVFASVFSVMHLTDLKFKLTPDILKQKFAHLALGQVLKRLTATSTDANVLVMVSQKELFGKVIPSKSVADQVPNSVWTAINNSLMIDVGHGEGTKGLKNSTSAITKLLKVYFPAVDKDGQAAVTNRLEIHA